MFLELTDHLRCPEDHDEAYLVLLPDRMENRNVESGEIGCPICHRTWRIVDGVLDFGGAPSAERGPSPLEGGAVAALTGLSGPGGYIVLAGPVVSAAPPSLLAPVPAVMSLATKSAHDGA